MNEKQRSLLKKQAEPRKNQMRNMRFVDGMTLDEIANFFGVTKQRVQQIIGRSGFRKSKKHLRPRFANKNPGTKYEKIVFDKLISLGYNVEMAQYGDEYDMLVCGKRVDVKGSTVISGKYGKFNLRAAQQKCDFFILVCFDSFYVIPYKDVSGLGGIMRKRESLLKYENKFETMEAT